MKKGLILLLSVVMVSSCAFPTSYHSEIYQEGYSEAKLSETEYTISFKGNTETSHQRLNDFALLRAAQVSLKNGYPYFRVLNSKPNVSYRNETRQQLFPYTYGYQSFEYAPTGYNNTDGTPEYGYITVTRYMTTYSYRPYQVTVATAQVLLTINLEKIQVKQRNLVLDAELTEKNIMKKYKIELPRTDS